MFKQKTLAALAVIGLVVTIGVSSVYAYQGNSEVTGPNYSPERHAAMQTALQNEDYQAWQALVGNRPIAQKINQENFAKFAEAWQLAQNGKLDEARVLRQELNLGQGMRQEGSGNHLMHRGAKMGGHFVDTNHDGLCDNFDQK